MNQKVAAFVSFGFKVGWVYRFSFSTDKCKRMKEPHPQLRECSFQCFSLINTLMLPNQSCQNWIKGWCILDGVQNFIRMSYLAADSTFQCFSLINKTLFQDKPEAGALVLANDLKQLGQSPGLLGWALSGIFVWLNYAFYGFEIILSLGYHILSAIDPCRQQKLR